MDLPEEAQAYAQADFCDVNQRFVQRLFALVGPAHRLEAIDLGTGPADIPILVSKYRPGWRITGLDGSAAMLELARQRLRAAPLASVRLIQADAKETGLPPGSFDLVFSNSLLHHVADPDRFWAEVRRLARPGALVLHRDLQRPASSDDARAIVRTWAGSESDLLQREFHRSLLAAYILDEVSGQLERAGLASLSVAPSSDRHLDVFGRLS